MKPQSMLVVAHYLDTFAVKALHGLLPPPRIEVRVATYQNVPIHEDTFKKSVVLWSGTVSMRGSCLRVPQVLPDTHHMLPPWVPACAGVIVLNPQAPPEKLAFALQEALKITWPSVLRGRVLRAGEAFGPVLLGSC